MHETGHSKTVHWDDPEGRDGMGGRQKMIRTFPVGFGIQRHLLELWWGRGELSSRDGSPAGLGGVMDEKTSGHPGEIVGTGNKLPGLCCSWQEAKRLGNP